MERFFIIVLANIFISNVFAALPNFNPLISSDFRTFDGTYNNIIKTLVGAADTELFRKANPDYFQGDKLAGHNRKSAREISNIVCRTNKSILNDKGLSDYLWQWGQFLDHDIDLTEGASPRESNYPIIIPKGDIPFDPAGTGTQVMPFDRSAYQMVEGVRQQLNFITAFVDGSNVYGSGPFRALKLRKESGDTALLKTSAGNLLPFNIDKLPNAPTEHDPSFFVAGDIRANEQVGLTAMHTLFVREHNYLVNKIRRRHPNLEDIKVYHMARKIVGAEIQAITYREFLPALLAGKRNVTTGSKRHYPLKPYTGYKENVDPSIANVFSTAAYRYGHSNLSPQILRLDKKLREIPQGHLALRDAFFNPLIIIQEGGIEPILRGLAYQVSQNIDVKVIDDLRNFLFGPPPLGFDLASLNIQRGRDHGLPPYNAVRHAYGLKKNHRFADITRKKEITKRLKKAYGNANNIDVWVGALAEDHYKEASVGQLNYHIIKDQFERLRDGDRFWYETSLPPTWVNWVNQQTLHHIIVRNTSIRSKQLPLNVFFARPLVGNRR